MELSVKETEGDPGREPLDNATRLQLERMEVKKDRMRQITEQEDRQAQIELEAKCLALEQEEMQLNYELELKMLELQSRQLSNGEVFKCG